MNGEFLWDKICSELHSAPVEFVTVPSNKKEQLWFIAYVDNGVVYVDNSRTKKPSTKMSQRRKISRDDFLTVYAYYHRWANGERHLRQEVRSLSRNTAYIFGLVAKLE